MAEIGRLDIGAGLRRFFEVKGGIAPSLGEGIVPTVLIADLEDSPFGIADRFSHNATAIAVLAQYSYVVIRPGASLPRNAWISVERVIITAAIAQDCYILPYILSSVPAGLTDVGFLQAMKQANAGTGTLRRITAATLLYGASATAPNGDGVRVRAVANSTVVIEGPWAINDAGALVAVTSTTNINLEAAFIGRIHTTSST